MRRVFSIISVLFLMSGNTTWAQSLAQRFPIVKMKPMVYECQKTSEGTITIDGKLDEDAWKNAPETTPFLDICGKEAAKYRTTARMLWDYTYFYVAAVLPEPKINARLQHRDEIIWKENDFEVFLDPNGDGVEYYEIETNAIGTLLDLFMSRPYRNGGQFFSAWDCPGLKVATHIEGTLNDDTDTDNFWSVELAIPHKALSVGFDDGLKQSNLWRVNFSRVEWLKKGGPEENWVWAPTGEVNIHMPECWGYVHLSKDGKKAKVDLEKHAARCLLSALSYAQQSYKNKHKAYTNDAAKLGFTNKDAAHIQGFRSLRIEATTNFYEMRLQTQKAVYTLDFTGRFSSRKLRK